MKILYADDDIDDCELVVEALETIDPQIECTMVSDGQQALTLLTEDMHCLITSSWTLTCQ